MLLCNARFVSGIAVPQPTSSSLTLGNDPFSTESNPCCSWDDLREYLPWDYASSKKMEKDILAQYKRLAGMSATNAKYRYILHTRSLPTYGYTFFKVEKCPKEQQTQWVLLGVSKDNILILDAETKEPLSCTPLANLAQWKLLNHTLTLNFVDRMEEFFSKDDHAISQVIADYIYYNVEKEKKLRKKRRTSVEEFRPGSPPTSLTLKDRELLAKRLTSMGKQFSFEELFGTVAPGMQSPSIKKSPMYVNPNK